MWIYITSSRLGETEKTQNWKKRDSQEKIEKRYFQLGYVLVFIDLLGDLLLLAQVEMLI